MKPINRIFAIFIFTLAMLIFAMPASAQDAQPFPGAPPNPRTQTAEVKLDSTTKAAKAGLIVEIAPAHQKEIASILANVTDAQREVNFLDQAKTAAENKRDKWIALGREKLAILKGQAKLDFDDYDLDELKQQNGTTEYFFRKKPTKKDAPTK